MLFFAVYSVLRNRTSRVTLPFMIRRHFSAKDKRCGPRPLGLYYAMLQQNATWQGVLQQHMAMWNPMMMNPAMNPMAASMMPNPLDQLPAISKLGVMENLPKDADKTFLAGVKAYHEAEWERPQPELKYELIQEYGRAALYKCGGEGERSILLVPSFVNRSYIFDLVPDTSLVNYLIDAGYSVYMMDWGDPELQVGETIGVEEAITQCLVPALAKIGENPFVLGYCMGGVLAMAAVQLAKVPVAGLITVAQPWDFSATQAHEVLKNVPWPLEQALEMSPLIPVDIIQAWFGVLDPNSAVQRVSAFTKEMPEADLHRLIALEDWLGDGVAMDPAAVKTILLDWHKDNVTYERTWKVGGEVIHPTRVQVPTFVVVTKKDKLVPPASTQPVIDGLFECTALHVDAGHVGVMAGRKAKILFYEPLTAWLAQHG